MKYTGMPQGMWILFAASFKNRLSSVLGYDGGTAEMVVSKAKMKYREIIGNLPEFEKGDRFRMNIVSCAMFSAFLLSLPEKPSVEKATEYYRESMMTFVMKWFCRMSGKKKFTAGDIEAMKKTAAFRAGDRNPYSWNMEYLPYPDKNGYEVRFTKCGICMLMNELGLNDMIPAMCQLDYTMSEAGKASVFQREFTIASGGPYCDCGYRRKDKSHEISY